MTFKKDARLVLAVIALGALVLTVGDRVSVTTANGQNAPKASAAKGPPEITPKDYMEIQQLYYKYALALDTGDGPGRAATFVPDGQFRSQLSNQKPETVNDISARTTRNGNTGGRHLQYNIILTPTLEGATSVAYVVILNRVGKPSPDGYLRGNTGFYNDTLVRTPKGWRFKTRQVWTDTAEDSPYRPKAE